MYIILYIASHCYNYLSEPDFSRISLCAWLHEHRALAFWSRFPVQLSVRSPHTLIPTVSLKSRLPVKLSRLCPCFRIPLFHSLSPKPFYLASSSCMHFYMPPHTEQMFRMQMHTPAYSSKNAYRSCSHIIPETKNRQLHSKPPSLKSPVFKGFKPICAKPDCSH